MPDPFEKEEIAAGIRSNVLNLPSKLAPYPTGHPGIPGRGGIARPWTGPTPWAETETVGRDRTYRSDSGEDVKVNK